MAGIAANPALVSALQQSFAYQTQALTGQVVEQSRDIFKYNFFVKYISEPY